MAWTSHGYQIVGTIAEDPINRPRVGRCGGPALCKQCSSEADAAQRAVGFELGAKKDVTDA